MALHLFKLTNPLNLLYLLNILSLLPQMLNLVKWKNSMALHLFKLTNPLHLLYLLHLLSLQPIYNKLEKRQLGFPNNKLPKRNKWPKIGLMQNFQVMNLKSIKLWTISFPSNPPNPPNLLHLLLKQSKWQSRLDWWWSPWFEKPLRNDN